MSPRIYYIYLLFSSPSSSIFIDKNFHFSYIPSDAFTKRRVQRTYIYIYCSFWGIFCPTSASLLLSPRGSSRRRGLPSSCLPRPLVSCSASVAAARVFITLAIYTIYILLWSSHLYQKDYLFFLW